MTGQEVTALGLIVNVAGVAVAFFVGFPQPGAPRNYMVWGEPDTPEVAAHERRRWISVLGLALMGIGFALQLGGVVLA